MCDDGDFSEVFFQSIILCIAPRQALAEISRSRRFPACLQPWLGLCRANEAHLLWRSQAECFNGQTTPGPSRNPWCWRSFHNLKKAGKLKRWKGQLSLFCNRFYSLCVLLSATGSVVWQNQRYDLLSFWPKTTLSTYQSRRMFKKSRGSSSKSLNLASGSLISCQGFFLPMIGLGKNGTEKGPKSTYPEVTTFTEWKTWLSSGRSESLDKFGPHHWFMTLHEVLKRLEGCISWAASSDYLRDKKWQASGYTVLASSMGNFWTKTCKGWTKRPKQALQLAIFGRFGLSGRWSPSLPSISKRPTVSCFLQRKEAKDLFPTFNLHSSRLVKHPINR